MYILYSAKQIVSQNIIAVNRRRVRRAMPCFSSAFGCKRLWKWSKQSHWQWSSQCLGRALEVQPDQLAEVQPVPLLGYIDIPARTGHPQWLGLRSRFCKLATGFGAMLHYQGRSLHDCIFDDCITKPTSLRVTQPKLQQQNQALQKCYQAV